MRRPGRFPRCLRKKELTASGARLVTADGFGCTSCHKIGEWTPKKVALNARGTELSVLGDRMRKPWFDRWVRNPARIVPRMEMPSIVTPARKILDENLDHQLAAVWHVLNQPGLHAAGPQRDSPGEHHQPFAAPASRPRCSPTCWKRRSTSSFGRC